MSNKYWKTDNLIYIGDPFGDAVELTQEEFDALSLENTVKEHRAKRDALLQTTIDAMNPMRWETLTELQKDAWRTYRQALLDVPQQEGFPTDVVWPVLEEGFNE